MVPEIAFAWAICGIRSPSLHSLQDPIPQAKNQRRQESLEIYGGLLTIRSVGIMARKSLLNTRISHHENGNFRLLDILTHCLTPMCCSTPTTALLLSQSENRGLSAGPGT